MPLLAPRLIQPESVPPLRWGIIGPGNIARAWTRALRHSTQRVTAVASRTPGRADDFAREFEVLVALTRYEDLVARDDIDAIYVATQPNDHARAALLALEAGKPVLVEKPFTKNVSEAAAVFARARELNLLAMEAMWTRYLPQMDVVRQLVAQGAIGEPSFVSASFCEDQRGVERMWRKDHGSPLWDMGIYPISFAQMLLGEPDDILAFGSVLDNGVDAESTSRLTHPSGARALLTVSGLTDSPLHAVVSGDEGVIEVAAPFIFPTAVGLAGKGLGAPVEWWRDESGIGRHDALVYQVLAFADYVSQGLVESPLQAHEDSLACLRTATEIARVLGADPY